MTIMSAVSGYHLIANGSGVSCEPGDIARFLLRARLLTGLTKIAPPCISEEYGQGIVLIAESHICVAVHGVEAWADVFSCVPFRARAVLCVLRAIFGGHWAWAEFRRSVPAAWPSAGGSSGRAATGGGSGRSEG